MLEEAEARIERDSLGEVRPPAWAWSMTVVNMGTLTNGVRTFIIEKGYLTSEEAGRPFDVLKMTEGSSL